MGHLPGLRVSIFYWFVGIDYIIFNISKFLHVTFLNFLKHKSFFYNEIKIWSNNRRKQYKIHILLYLGSKGFRFFVNIYLY